jgi:hypothetical protein
MTSFEYIRSRGAHGHHAVGQFDAFVGSEREIWVGDDGSGMIRSTSGPAAFFSDNGRARWEAAGSPQLEHGPSIALFAPDCLGGSQSRRARLARDPDGIDTALVKYTKRLKDTQALLGEGVVSAELCRAAYNVASRLPGVASVDQLSDELGRAGRGLVEIDRGERLELIFADDLTELYGYRRTLTEPREYAPAGTVHSWSAYLQRGIVAELPAGSPPVPQLPCEHFSGRGFTIRPGFSIMTGYVSDAVAQLAAMRDQGVITDTEYDTALTYQNPSQTP